MKSFVLMSKNNGQLVIGFRVAFFDNQQAHKFETLDGWSVCLCPSQHEGWVITTGDLINPFYLNNHCEELMEVLGEL